MTRNTKPAIQKDDSKPGFPFREISANIYSSDIQISELPTLDEVTDKTNSIFYQKQLRLSDGSIILAKREKNNSETISFYRKVGETYNLNGLHLLFGESIDERRYGEVSKIGQSFEENSEILSAESVRKYRPQIKELQALVAQYAEALEEFTLTELREYK